MHLFYADLLDESFRYACSMPEEADVFITVGSEKMKKMAEERFKNFPCHNCKILLTPNRGRDVGSVLVAVNPDILKYDYVCFAHDKKVTQLKQQSVGASWAYECFESVLKNRAYVSNIIETFEKNPRLGLLTPAPPQHADYFPTMSNEWGANFKATKALAKELNIRVPISQNFPPISALGCFFWYRPKAMKKLYDRNWKFEEFPEEPIRKTDGTILHAIERLYSFAVQDAGYYPAWGFSDNIAAIEITNLYYMLRTINQAITTNGIGGKFVDVVQGLNVQGSAVRALNTLHFELNELYGEKTAGLRPGSMMKLYYDEGVGYSENLTVTGAAALHGKRFGVQFVLPKKNVPIRQIRFDPGEEGMLLIEKFQGYLEYEDGSTKQIDHKCCETNGFGMDEKIIFLGADPQIAIPCGKGKRVKAAFFSGDVSTIPQDLMEKTIQRKAEEYMQKSMAADPMSRLKAKIKDTVKKAGKYK